MFEYFDIHSHLYFKDFDADREEEIDKIKEAKIATITIGTDFESSQKAVEMAEINDNLFACVGIHPDDVKTDSVFDERLVALASHPKVVAIGETGLDYFSLGENPEETKKVQKEIFHKHIDLALAVGKPLMIHIRSSERGANDAYDDALDLLEIRFADSGGKLRGNFHFFVSNPETLKRILAIGFTVSFTGVITFTHDYDELVRQAPLESIMSETDTPFVTPKPHRGKRNSPFYVPFVVEKIAEIKGLPLETVKKALLDNALRYIAH